METVNQNESVKSGTKGLKIYAKTEDMVEYLYTVLRQYPRSEKFVLAAETKKAALELLELIISCNKHYMKKNHYEGRRYPAGYIAGYGEVGA